MMFWSILLSNRSYRRQALEFGMQRVYTNLWLGNQTQDHQKHRQTQVYVHQQNHKPKSLDVIPSLKGDKCCPWLREIQGKLYALCVDDSDDDTAFASASESAVHIVYTERPQKNEEPEAYLIRTLASVLGSEEATKEALLYSYTTAASGFSAKLTPQQVEEISKQPGVLQVLPSRTLQLHSGPGIGRLQ